MKQEEVTGMRGLSVAAQELQRRNLERAALIYAKSCDRGSVEHVRARAPRADVSERDMDYAVFSGLMQILVEDLDRRKEPPKIDPRDL